MPIYYTNDNRLVVAFNVRSRNKFKLLISKELIQRFGQASFSSSKVEEILTFCMTWYSEEFLKLIRAETDLALYKGLFILHEFSCQFQSENPNESPIPQMSNEGFAMYRRILRLVLEQGCDLYLNSKVSFTWEYLKKKQDIIDDILHLGDEIYEFSNLLAEQKLIEDCFDLSFTSEGLYDLKRKHQYDFIIKSTYKSFKSHFPKSVTGKNDFTDFYESAKRCLGVDFDNAASIIPLVRLNSKNATYILPTSEWQEFPKKLEAFFQTPFQNAKIFYQGLTLTKDNKLPLLTAVYKPQNINRHLYRPILIWNVDGKDIAIVSLAVFHQSIINLCTNAFGWEKYPIEWSNDCFKTFIEKKKQQNDKILEDAAEKILKDNNVIYDRNVTCLKKWNNRNINIQTEECGEIDFLFLYDNKIFLADSKHLVSRYEMNNFKNDVAYFEDPKKGYNKTLTKKLRFLKSKELDIEEHFQVTLNNRNFKLSTYTTEGVFVINTPTFVIYNNDYRVYTLKTFEELVTGKFIDEVYYLITEDGDHITTLPIKYPYFRKPRYIYFQDEDDD